MCSVHSRYSQNSDLKLQFISQIFLLVPKSVILQDRYLPTNLWTICTLSFILNKLTESKNGIVSIHDLKIIYEDNFANKWSCVKNVKNQAYESTVNMYTWQISYQCYCIQ